MARFYDADNDLLSTLKAGTKLKAQATGSKQKPRASGQEPKGIEFSSANVTTMPAGAAKDKPSAAKTEGKLSMFTII